MKELFNAEMNRYIYFENAKNIILCGDFAEILTKINDKICEFIRRDDERIRLDYLDGKVMKRIIIVKDKKNLEKYKFYDSLF